MITKIDELHKLAENTSKLDTDDSLDFFSGYRFDDIIVVVGDTTDPVKNIKDIQVNSKVQLGILETEEDDDNQPTIKLIGTIIPKTEKDVDNIKRCFLKDGKLANIARINIEKGSTVILHDAPIPEWTYVTGQSKVEVYDGATMVNCNIKRRSDLKLAKGSRVAGLNAEHLVTGSFKNSTIINDKYHGVFLNTMQMKHAMLYNGIIADHSEISGPQQSNLRLLLDNLQFSNNTLDFKLDDKSVKVAGASWYHKNTHTDSVYYTNLHNNKTFNDVNTVHSRNFKEAFLPQTLLENEQALHDLNEFDPSRPNASVKDSLMAIHNKAKEVGEELNNISNPSLNKSDDLEL